MPSSAPYSRTPSAYVPTSIWETKFHTRVDQEAKFTSDVSLCGWKSCLFLLLQKSSGWGTSNTSGNSQQWCPAVALFSTYYNSCVTPNVVFRKNPDRVTKARHSWTYLAELLLTDDAFLFGEYDWNSTERAQCTLTWGYSRWSKLKNMLH
jgi:hypothetical protein